MILKQGEWHMIHGLNEGLFYIDEKFQIVVISTSKDKEVVDFVTSCLPHFKDFEKFILQ